MGYFIGKLGKNGENWNVWCFSKVKHSQIMRLNTFNEERGKSMCSCKTNKNCRIEDILSETSKTKFKKCS